LLEAKVKELQRELPCINEKHEAQLLQAKEKTEAYKDCYKVQLKWYKEKYKEAKENIREARQMQITTE
jgi:hypothetical protein